MAGLQGSRILVTGGAGLIGSHLVDRLLDESPAGVVVFDNFVRGRLENLAGATRRGPVTVVEGDLRDRAALADALDGVDYVFHQAAIRITQCAEDPRLALDVLVGGTFNVVEAAARAKVRKLVAASTASVYGMADTFPTSETHHPYHNRTFYGAAKAFNEGILRSFNEMTGLSYVALRYFNVYGPRMDVFGAYTEVLIRWMERIDAGIPPLILGDGLQTMDFIHADDVARANVLAAKSDASDAVFNVATGAEISLNELAARLLKVMGSDLEPEYGPARAVNPVPRRLADVRAAREALGFSAAVPLDRGLAGLVNWWRATAPKPVAAVAAVGAAARG